MELEYCWGNNSASDLEDYESIAQMLFSEIIFSLPPLAKDWAINQCNVETHESK